MIDNVDCPDLSTSEHCDNCFGKVWSENQDIVALFDPQIDQCHCQPLHFIGEGVVGVDPLATVNANPHQCRFVSSVGVQMLANGVFPDINFTLGKPAIKWSIGGVKYLFVGRFPG